MASRCPPVIDLGKAERLLRSDVRYGKESRVSVVDILRILRHQDSKIFWGPSVSGLAFQDNIFVSGKVMWHGKQDNPPDSAEGEELCIDGYLDLSQALTEEKRYESCLRALRRCMNLFPQLDVLASDDLIRSLTLEANRRRYGPRAQTSGKPSQPAKRLIIGSIRVTSSTVNRYLQRADVPDGSRAIYLFNHPSAPADHNNLVFAALEWYPSSVSIAEKTDQHVSYERIPGTPYIGKGGERAIVMPRFQRPSPTDTALTHSLYERSPEQTYQDFYQLGILKMGHWVYGSSHDLFTLNLARAVELSALDNGPLFQWLIQCLKKLCFTRDKGTRWAQAVVIYPSHPVTDQIVAVLSRYFAPHSQKRQGNVGSELSGGIIPLKFLAGKTVSPFRASPLSCERLEQQVSWLCSHNSSRSVVILDDGTLSGKMFREMEQLARSIGAAEVHTIALVDRGGLPIHLEYMEQYLANNHRFWRWDVPPLGHRRGCPLCSAVAQASTMRGKSFMSASVEARLGEWFDMWSPVEVMDHWETHGLTPKPLGIDVQCDTHRFGIYPNGPTTVHHTIRHKTSSSMAAAIMEITRSTTHSCYAIEKSRRMAACYGPETAIEILAAQLLLFLDELDYWNKVDIFVNLLHFLWKCQEDSKRTALAGLCVTLAEDDLVLEVWRRFKQETLCQEYVQKTDARIATEYLRARFNALSPVRDACSASPSNAERYNYSIMFNDGSFRRNVGRILDILGASHGQIHNLGLWDRLGKLEDSIAGKEYAQIERRLEEVRSIVQDLLDAVSQLDVRSCIPDGEYKPEPDSDVLIMRNLLDELPTAGTISNSHLSQLSSWVANAKMVLVAEEGRNSFACRYRSAFVEILPARTARNAFLGDMATRICEKDWPSIVAHRVNSGKTIAARWVDKSRIDKTRQDRPIIEGGNDCTWEENILLYFDRYVEHCIYEILSNCIHVAMDMANPWLATVNSAICEPKATMWWRAFVGPHYVDLEFINVCDTGRISTSQTEARSGLERVGGSVACFVAKKSGDRITCVPAFPEEQLARYCGLTTGQRVAISIVRIPRIETTRGEVSDAS